MNKIYTIKNGVGHLTISRHTKTMVIAFRQPEDAREFLELQQKFCNRKDIVVEGKKRSLFLARCSMNSLSVYEYVNKNNFEIHQPKGVINDDIIFNLEHVIQYLDV